MRYESAGQRTRRRARAFFTGALWLVMLSACSAARQQPVQPPPPPPAPPPRVVQVPVRDPMFVSVVPTARSPIRVGTQLGFQLSSNTAGYASLYLIDPVGQVSVLTENLPLAAGSLVYPSSSDGFTLVASQPVGANRVIALVTRQPFDGFSGEATLTSPVSLAPRGREFVAQLDRATALLPRGSWTTDEIEVRVEG